MPWPPHLWALPNTMAPSRRFGMNCVIWGFVEVLETIVVKKPQFRKGRVRIWKSVSVVKMEVENPKPNV